MAKAPPGEWWHPLPNVWLGVSVEDQATADERIPLLLDTPAAVRFVSYEPALGPVDFQPWLKGGEPLRTHVEHTTHIAGPRGCTQCRWRPPYKSRNWLITGGESGPGARPSHPDWFRQARDQCQAAGVAFLFKQHGEYLHESQVFGPDVQLIVPEEMDVLSNKKHHRHKDGTYSFRIGKKAAGRLLDGKEWSEYP